MIQPYAVFGRAAIDSGTLEQMDIAIGLPVAVKGALMPDAHQGYGLPIGGVLATKDAIIPYGVGMDIGCRMHLSVFDCNPDILQAKRQWLATVLKDNTHFGKSDFPDKEEHHVLDHPDFKNIPFLSSMHQKASAQLGTSGSGNHFVDFGIFTFNNNIDGFNIKPGNYLALLSHSGSRNLGAEIARHYTRIAKAKTPAPKKAKQLAWFDIHSSEGDEYWRAMKLAGAYSSANHEIIHNKISKALNITPCFQIENHHNFAWKEKLPSGENVIMHRKGATPAHKGTLGIIPGSMTEPAYIVRGKAHEEALNSAAHGAGRRISRKKAKQHFTHKELHEILERAGVMLIGGGIDEIPGAYKNIEDIMQYQEPMVETLANFYPKIVIMDKG